MTILTTMRDEIESPLTEGLDEFFLTKTSCDVDGTMSWFSHDLATYTDATLGWDCDSFDAVKAVFDQYMPNWGRPPVRTRPGPCPTSTAH